MSSRIIWKLTIQRCDATSNKAPRSFAKGKGDLRENSWRNWKRKQDKAKNYGELRKEEIFLARNKQTIRTVPISKAKISLNSLVKRVHRDKEYLILKDNGTPLAAVMDIDEFEDYLEVNDPRVRKEIELSNEDFRAGRFRPAEEFLEELRREQRSRAKS